MSFTERLANDLKEAMRAKDELRLSTLRMIRAEILKQEKAKAKVEMSDDNILAIIERQAKQRRDSIEQYLKGDRNDLAEIEQGELEILLGYLPEKLSEAEIDEALNQVLADTGATSMAQMGQVMGQLMSALKQTGKTIDGTLVSQRVKERLNQ